jgi:hypothetical protein
MKSIRSATRLAATALVAAGLLCINAVGTAAFAATNAHDHGHAPAAKPLPAGKRWATDTPLRESMARIRAAFEPKLGAIHNGKLAPADYKALAQATEAQVANIVANCKLPPDADAALHGVLAQIGEGSEAMSGKAGMKPRDGALKVVKALGEYGRTFDHPGWKALHG